jgi:two-component system phosphate regulon response regulator PhoB
MDKMKILVVEDEAPIQELLQFNLDRNKYRVKVVDSGEEALTVASQFKPDLILLDIMLPGADGLEVCKRLKTDSKTDQIPIIMLSPAKPVSNSELIHVHNITIDVARHKVEVDGKNVVLTYTEFKVLQLMAQQPGRVFTRYQIVDAVHGDDYPVTDRSVDVQIVGLRKKLGDAGKNIETVRGIGYRFKEEE